MMRFSAFPIPQWGIQADSGKTLDGGTLVIEQMAMPAIRGNCGGHRAAILLGCCLLNRSQFFAEILNMNDPSSPMQTCELFLGLFAANRINLVEMRA
jgi:hypothetical protein